jgi:hypothetical protein
MTLGGKQQFLSCCKKKGKIKWPTFFNLAALLLSRVLPAKSINQISA